ncbi:TetR/AcrR family transcriptional regulator [Corallococcus praedator]|uniref:TetR/AcrR family transcriptional regulator n=1 Tax=Corallococcus praedator TaxID=2316724 RepID=A0ABX9QFM8_9BACT|nr:MULTISPECIES: TetR/AcrR family transcriptional regulator [Corallococcus]RKH09626.1 TetR/AcrR family transcriptional regulator [Corallococcus sp. CA047B]RKH29073.1 TetR/AcrR family transcriptional regulator [Corallococcus sp. CA031C]RKI06628.1 TetR/AcrR family transcriptional regulator [Corallococcus praedator]
MARPRTFDEAQVLRAVRDQFWNKGYAATSMDDLMRATGLGKGSLYGAFGDKHQLFLRIFDSYCANSAESMRQALEGSEAGALERLRQYMLGVATASAGPSRRGCLLARGTAELAAEGATDVTDRALQAFQGMEARFTECLAQAQRHGDVAASADPRKLAAMLLAVFRGLEALGKAGMDEASLRGMVETAFEGLPVSARRRR